MGFYEEMQEVATEVLTGFKQGIVNYIKITPGTGPVTNPGQPTETPFGLNCGVNGVSKQYVDGTQVLSSDLQCVAAVNAGYTPNMKDAIDVDGVRHKLVKILPKPAAGTPVAYLYIIRRGG